MKARALLVVPRSMPILKGLSGFITLFNLREWNTNRSERNLTNEF